MKLRAIIAASLTLALTACATTGVGGNAVEARWNGQQAGAFFAKFGPPNSDGVEGSDTVYAWRGGFRSRSVAAKYEELPGGKRGKLISPARIESLSCSVRLRVSPDYVIRGVQIVSDRTGTNGKTYCEELLGDS